MPLSQERRSEIESADAAVLAAIAPEEGHTASDSKRRHIVEKTGLEDGVVYESLQRLKIAGKITWSRENDWELCDGGDIEKVYSAIENEPDPEPVARDIVLSAIEEKPRKVRELAELAGVTTGRVQQVLNTLRRENLVERSDSFEDGPGGGFTWRVNRDVELLNEAVEKEREKYEEEEVLLEPWRGFSRMTVKETRDFLRQLVLDFDYSESLRYLLNMVWAWDNANKRSTYLHGDLLSYSEQMRLKSLEQRGVFLDRVAEKRSTQSPFEKIGEELRARWQEYSEGELRKMVMSFTNGKDEFIDNMARQAYYEINRRMIAPA